MQDIKTKGTRVIFNSKQEAINKLNTLNLKEREPAFFRYVQNGVEYGMFAVGTGNGSYSLIGNTADWMMSANKPSTSWSEITGKPSTFTPSEHTHNYLGINNDVSIGTTSVYDKLSVVSSNTNVLGVYNSTPYGAGVKGASIAIGKLEGGARQVMVELHASPMSPDDSGSGKFSLKVRENGVLNDAMTILSNTNVGFGTNNPTDKLHVIGSIRSSSNIYGNVGVFDRVGIGIPDSNAKLAVAGDIFSNTGVFCGEVGNSAHQLVIGASGRDYWEFNEWGGDFRFFRTMGGGKLELMRINPNGVGVGTNNPNYKLHVEGDIYSSRNVICNDVTLNGDGIHFLKYGNDAGGWDGADIYLDNEGNKDITKLVFYVGDDQYDSFLFKVGSLNVVSIKDTGLDVNGAIDSWGEFRAYSGATIEGGLECPDGITIMGNNVLFNGSDGSVKGSATIQGGDANNTSIKNTSGVIRSVERTGTGNYKIYHNIGHENYKVIANIIGASSTSVNALVVTKASSFVLIALKSGGSFTEGFFFDVAIL